MQTATLAAPREDVVLRNVIQHAEGATLEWSDGYSSFFHFIWLRDCCYCDSCGDSYSSKRYILPSDIPLEIQPAGIEVTAQGSLSINWLPDGHASHYDHRWLRAHCYDDAARKARFHQPWLWDAKLTGSLPGVAFTEVQADEIQLLNLYRKLRDFGFVVVTGGPAIAGGVESIAKLVGNLGESAYARIFDLAPASAVKTMGNTHKAVPPHTDEAFRYSPPGINVLGCVKPAVDGGESILVDGFSVAERLRRENPEAFGLLCRYQQTFNRIHPGSLDHRARQRVITLDDRGEVVGIRLHTRAAGPLDLPADRVKAYYAAHQQFCELMMNADNQVRFQLRAGDCVLFDNHRVLHSRAEFQDSTRFLQICNVDRETFHERLRLLAARNGFGAEANQVLAPGVC